MTATARTIVVTGAAGMIGRHLCERLRREGWTVRAMMRDPSIYPFREKGIECSRIDLPERIDDSALRDADVLVHAAFATRPARGVDARAVNETGSARLFGLARGAGIARIVFVSSFSAALDAPSSYGRSKARVEGMLRERDTAVRAGLVLAPDGGVALRIWQSIARWHVAPLFDAGRQLVQTVHVDDLTEAIVRVLALDARGIMHIAEPVGLRMRELLTEMARAISVRCLLVPLSSNAVVLALRSAERLGLTLPVSSDNLLGLLAQRHVDTTPDLARLDIRPRPARESIASLASRIRFR